MMSGFQITSMILTSCQTPHNRTHAAPFCGRCGTILRPLWSKRHKAQSVYSPDAAEIIDFGGGLRHGPIPCGSVSAWVGSVHSLECPGAVSAGPD